MATPRAHEFDCHHIRDSTVGTMNSENEKDGGMRLSKISCADRCHAAWKNDPREYYSTQFNHMIAISAFSGGVQVAIISFMNDLLSGDDLKVHLFNTGAAGSGDKIYSTYSVGIMLGLIGVVLNLTVAAIVALDAALAFHFTIEGTDRKASIEKRIVFLMLLQFMAALFSAISLVLLCIRFDLSFTIVAAIFFLSAVVISAYDLIWIFGSKWSFALKTHPQHVFSFFFSTAALAFEIVSPSPASMFIISTYAVTVIFHLMSALRNSSLNRPIPRKRAVVAVFTIAGLWVACAASTWFWRYRRPDDGFGLPEKAKKWVSAVFAGVEAVILFLTGIYYTYLLFRVRYASSSDGPHN